MPSITDSNDASPLMSWIADAIGDPTEMTRNKQMVVGGVSGWLTGYVSGKVGKMAAVGLGGAILVGMVAVEKGYVKVNWSRVNRDLRSVQQTIESEAGRSSSGIVRAVVDYAKKNGVIAASFCAGLLLGVSSA